MRKRSHQIIVRLNDGELAHLRCQLRKCDLTQEAYLRMLISNRVPRETPPLAYFDLLREFHAIGNNLNQIAARANSTGDICAKDYAREVESLRSAILKIQAAVTAPDIGGRDENI